MPAHGPVELRAVRWLLASRHSTADQFSEGPKFATRGRSSSIFDRVVKYDGLFSGWRKCCPSTHRASQRGGDRRFTQELI